MGYLAWAWNPATSQITITQDGVQGISWATAYNWLDIALAIVANGWVGVGWTEQCEQRHMCSEIKFILSNNTFFWGMERQITLLSTTPAITAALPWWLILGAGSGFRLGNIDDDPKKVSSRGCHILNNCVAWQGPLFRWQAGGTRELLSCAFTNVNHATLLESSLGGRIWNCISNNQYVSNVSPEIYNTIFTDGTFGLNYPYGVTDRLTVQHKTSAVYALAAFALLVSNSIFRDNTFTLRAVNTVAPNKFLLNCDSDAWLPIDWAAGPCTALFIRQYNFDCTVVDRVTGAGIIGAIVTLYDQTGAVVFTIATGAGGAIPTQTITYETYADAGGVYPHTNTTTVAYHPFTMTVTYPTYHTYIKPSIDFGAGTRRLYENVALCRAPDLVFVDDHVALNLDAENPESELFTHI